MKTTIKITLSFLIVSFFSCKAYEDSILTIREIKAELQEIENHFNN